MSRVICDNCGAEYDESEEYCPQCGDDVFTYTAEEYEDEEEDEYD